MVTGVRWWIRFCHELAMDPLLYTRDELPLSHVEQVQVESKLLLYTMWLARHRFTVKAISEPQSLRGSTLRAYAIHVQMWMQQMMGGMPMKDISTLDGRLRALQHAFMRERPSQLDEKEPFTAAMFRKLQHAVLLWKLGSRDAVQKKSEQPASFCARRTEMMVAAAMEALLRTSELARGYTDSAANLNPFVLDHLHFCYTLNGGEHECPWNADGTIDTSQAEYLRVPMSAHKADQFGQRGDQLMYPRSTNAKETGTFELTDAFVNDYPVPRGYHNDVAWFRKGVNVLNKQKGSTKSAWAGFTGGSNLFGISKKQKTRYDAEQNRLELNTHADLVTDASFWKTFKALCRTAEVRYDGLGTHCFRVGGMAGLQDANASVVEIMALGRWRSDAWKAYARRKRVTMMKWTGRVLSRAPPTKPDTR